MEGNEEEEMEIDREEWDGEITISDRIEALIDPEMNIEKVVEIIKEVNDFSYTKGESFNLNETFIKNFNDNYMIIKKVK